MKYTDILLDLDETLIDTAANTKITVDEIYKDYGLERYFDSFDSFFTFYHANVSKLWEAYNNGNITKDEIQAERFAVSLRHIEGFADERIQTINKDYVERIMTKDALVEGAIDLLNYLKPKYRLHILSNGFTEMQYKKMESANIALSYFDNVILSDVAGVNKPHPDIFAYALNKIGANRETVIMIGDNLQTDIIGAYRSGIDQIWFNPDNKESMYIRPTYVISKLSDIQDIL